MIGAEFGREDYDSIPRNCDRKEAGTTSCQNWSPNQIKLVVKTKKINTTDINYAFSYLDWMQRAKSFKQSFKETIITLFLLSLTNSKAYQYCGSLGNESSKSSSIRPLRFLRTSMHAMFDWGWMTLLLEKLTYRK
jgi:hypothetical protein